MYIGYHNHDISLCLQGLFNYSIKIPCDHDDRWWWSFIIWCWTRVPNDRVTNLSSFWYTLIWIWLKCCQMIKHWRIWCDIWCVEICVVNLCEIKWSKLPIFEYNLYFDKFQLWVLLYFPIKASILYFQVMILIYWYGMFI